MSAVRYDAPMRVAALLTELATTIVECLDAGVAMVNMDSARSGFRTIDGIDLSSKMLEGARQGVIAT